MESPDVDGGDLYLGERVETEQVRLEDELREGRGGAGEVSSTLLALLHLLVALAVRLESSECLAEFAALRAGVGLAPNRPGFVAEIVSLQTTLLGKLLLADVTREGFGA